MAHAPRAAASSSADAPCQPTIASSVVENITCTVSEAQGWRGPGLAFSRGARPARRAPTTSVRRDASSPLPLVLIVVALLAIGAGCLWYLAPQRETPSPQVFNPPTPATEPAPTPEPVAPPPV